ncbi:MAG TPA: hypothetical protein VGD66_05795 [Allosphingosinicella sp.]|jgi:cytochrome P450
MRKLRVRPVFQTRKEDDGARFRTRPPGGGDRLAEQLRDRVAKLCAQLLDGISDGSRFDVIAAYAAPIPTTIIAELLGIPPEDRLRFRGWTETIVIADTSDWAMLRALPSGRHFCLGSALARIEGGLAVGAFVQRFRGVRLAAEPRHLEWKGGATLRGLKSLPLHAS